MLNTDACGYVRMGVPTGDAARDIRVPSGLLPAAAGRALLAALTTVDGLVVRVVEVASSAALSDNMASFSSVRTLTLTLTLTPGTSVGESVGSDVGVVG